jgi:nicotinamide-nucleotide amidase
VDLEVVTIGTELLLGFTIDTNGAELGQALSSIGARIVRRTAVGDDADRIRSTVAEALQRSGVVITTGGLGPTRDDFSKKVVAQLYGWPLRFDEAIWQALVERFRRMGREPSPANRVQAEVPEGAVVLPNRWGTAPGLWLEGPPGLVIMLPGVPNEMRKLVAHEVVPRLAARGAGTVIRSRLVRTTSIPESTLAQRIGDLEDQLQPLTLAYLPGLNGVDLRLTAWGMEPAEADRMLAAAADRLKGLLGSLIYGEGETDLAAVLLQALKSRGLRLAIGESCTGGLIGARMTAIPGSSDVFAGSAVTYDNSAKTNLLSVEPSLLATHGAVSEPVALAMAKGAAARFGTAAAIGVTGIAGPDGGSEEKPVGTVCFGWVIGEREEQARYVFLGNRQEIRERAAQFAMHRLLGLLT